MQLNKELRTATIETLEKIITLMLIENPSEYYKPMGWGVKRIVRNKQTKEIEVNSMVVYSSFAIAQVDINSKLDILITDGRYYKNLISVTII